MPNYSNTVMYKLVCKNLSVTDIYVGHTTNFRMRKCSHKSKCNNADNRDHNLKIYQSIRQHGGWTNWTMVEIEKYPCSDANEARRRERELYELNIGLATLNSVVPFRSQKESWKAYREMNKEHINAKQKIYYNEHREHVSALKKLYYMENKAHIDAKHKMYRETHKEGFLAYEKAYRLKKKAERLAAAAAIEPETVEYVVDLE